ncbi:SusD/RagB family nutrient-binding outer membrane lipoprotein [Telluribacter sp. SYSU D00476]|uniref:SusD/RagB family nutrient-binding outer membrane lipoprotein n=1 Tax=Telluribacter sp. SYSU D00476 TaxID=2811430 RepID=UPI001FF5D47F|nr:SusD/RagB family nutrient-binding outer membrane lipoprotein [Telluribacter sp. SYSU D00476]
MNYFKHKILLLAAAGFLMTSCEKQAFVDINTNPDALSAVPPQNQFLNASKSIHDQDFEAYYDFYRRIMPWMQYTTDLNGNQGAFTQTWDNFSQRYGRLYNGIGDRLYDIEKLVEKMPTEEQARYQHMIRIARILRSYYTFYVSDIFGSIPYSEAFQARYGGTLQPGYDSQQEIFAQLDTDLKEAISTLKAAPSAPQVSLGQYDQYYGGNAQQWVKAGNALRLKIALRQVNADRTKAETIIKEVLSQPAGDLMASNEDSWVYRANAAFTGGGNFDPTTLRAPKPMVDFMWENKDPRLDAFFTPNSYSQANVDLLVANNMLPAGTQAPARRYVGSFTNPDEVRSQTVIQRYYTPRMVTSNGQQLSIDTLSFIQPRLFSATIADANGNAGTGFSYLPVITFADFAFMRAEAAARGITAESAKTWYETGVVSSIRWYDTIAQGANLTNYTPVTQAEIDAYMAEPEVAFNPAKALEQIASQAYLHFLKQPTEGWATWKRTGFPNANSVVPMPTLTNNGATLVLPRRAPLGLINPNDPNFANKQAAYEEMSRIQGFGRDPQDATGRVWWDRLGL